MSSICLAITRSPRLDATEQSCRDRARRMSVEASCGFDRGDSCRPPIVLVSARPRSNIRAVWHLDEFVVANVRAGPRVHVFPADFTVRQTVILGHGLVVPDFIYCPAVRAFKSFRHLKKYTLVRCWLPGGLLMVCNRRYPSAPALGRRAQARRGALPGQGLTHLFSSGRGVCNARGLRASGGGADQIRDPAVIIRFLFGVGEAGAFPGATCAMQLWYPREERGFVQGVTHSASRLGAAIAPPIVVLIMTTLGWRWVFYICGAVGILWSVWWYLTYRNLPEEHGLVNRAELEHVRGVDEKGNVKEPKIEKATTVPWRT